MADPNYKPAGGGLSYPEGLLRQFAWSSAFGLDNNLAGLVSALTGGDYKSAKDSYTAERDRFWNEHYWPSLAASLAGGFALPFDPLKPLNPITRRVVGRGVRMGNDWLRRNPLTPGLLGAWNPSPNSDNTPAPTPPRFITPSAIPGWNGLTNYSLSP